MQSDRSIEFTRIEFTVITRDARGVLVKEPPKCGYTYNRHAIRCIRDRVQRAFVEAPLDGFVEWTVRLSEIRSIREETSMESIVAARLRLDAFLDILEGDLAPKQAHHKDDSDDADTLVRVNPLAMRAGGKQT
jgi:hypothetical protein